MCPNGDSSRVARGAYVEGRGNYVDGSHTPIRYGQELLPIPERWVPVGRTVLWRRLPFCLRLATES